ncbi:MAG: carbon-nitrogen hydrolase [Bacteroidales bacterium]|nr:carbon-nitrogen hydrolase [Bacteroidales bacterium]
MAAYICNKIDPKVPNQKINVGIVQTYCTADKAENTERFKQLITKAARNGANIICLQELYNTLYFCNIEEYENFLLAEPSDSLNNKQMATLCKELSVVLVVPYFEKRASGIFHNSALVIDADGSILGNYRKQHIPDDPGYYEKFYFTPGDGGYKCFNTKYGNIGVLICWDQWFPEASRLTAMTGAEILFYPTAIGWPVGQDEKLNRKEFEAWQTMMRSHAIANGVHVVAVNRVGEENDNSFWGGSFIADPFGEIIYQAPHYEETVHVQQADLSLTGYFRERWPFFRDRRIDTYSDITKLFLEQ